MSVMHTYTLLTVCFIIAFNVRTLQSRSAVRLINIRQEAINMWVKVACWLKVRAAFLVKTFVNA